MPALFPLHLRTAAPAADSRVLESRQPLQTLSDILKRTTTHLLHPRQNGDYIAIPTQYAGLNSGPSPGAVVGITLGSVAGFLLLIWLLWVLSSGSGFIASSSIREEDVAINVRRRSRSRRRSRARTEMTSRSPLPAPRRDRVIRQERIVRDSVPVAPREQSRFRETVLVDEIDRPERRVEGDDIVEVIEEHDSIDVPPPRRKGRRSSGYRDDY